MARNIAWYDAQDEIAYERAATHVGGASQLVGDMNGQLVTGQVTSHAASSLVAPVTTSYEETRREDGGDAHDGDCYASWWADDANPFLLCDTCLASYKALNAMPRQTWLERIARRFPNIRVEGGA